MPKLRLATFEKSTNPASIGASPGTRKHWIIKYGQFILVADANAANRVLHLTIKKGGREIWRSLKSGTITAGVTGYWEINGIEYHVSSAVLGNTTYLNCGALELEDDMEIHINLTNGQVGDVLEGVLVVEETDSEEDNKD